MLKIRKVENDRDRMSFIKLPWTLYKDDKYWVPPLIFDVRNNLNPKKNPFFKHAEIELFLAELDGKLVGRIAAIKNDNHNKFHNDKTGFFGFFETIDNEDVSDLLLDTACDWCKSRGFDKIVGPVNPSTNDECGLLVDGFDSSPVMLMPYNPAFYANRIESFGFDKEKDLYAYFISSDVINDEKMMAKLERMANLIKKRYNIVTRTLKLKDLENEIRKVEYIYNDAWDMNWGFVPITSEEFDYMGESLKQVVDPNIVFFAEIDGKPAGFSLTLPNINQILKTMNGRILPFGIFKLLMGKNKTDILRVLIMGVRHEYQKKGIDSVFYLETIKEGNRKKVKGAEISWVLEDNYAMRQTAENLGAHIYKTYRIYSKNL
ncbi:MAG: N-acetyltransferase [Ignavibacteriae bacterium]|nr:MAG: N-acetyltransferase [Ignavibacteriota bacterium]